MEVLAVSRSGGAARCTGVTSSTTSLPAAAPSGDGLAPGSAGDAPLSSARRRREETLALAAALVTVLLWGSVFVGIRAAGEDLSGGALALGRLLVATVGLGGILLFQRRRSTARGGPRRSFPRERGDVALLAACGLLWFGAYNVVLNEGERRIDAGTAAMLVNIGPILIAILAGLLLSEGFPRTLVRGLAIAFAGAVIIGLATRGTSTDAAFGAVLCVVAAVLYAAGVVSQKPLLGRYPAAEITFAACAIGTVVTLPFAPTLLDELQRADAGAVAWMVYLGAFPTALAFSTWAYALQRTTAGRMGAFSYLVPPVAVLLGWVLLSESPPAAALAGGALCLAGVAYTRRG